MEKYRTCPVCREVPEQQVYQCRSGHILCRLCIEKVQRNICPHPNCKARVGQRKIRSKVCEDFLDSLEFYCKFKEQGCTRILKRGEITSHRNTCSHDPDAAPLCEQLGLGNCSFRVGCASRADVVSHFQQAHNCSSYLRQNLGLSFEYSRIMNKMKIINEVDPQKPTKRPFLCTMVSRDASETSPIFMLFGKLDQSTGFLSFYCVNVWESRSHPSIKYYANFSLVRIPPSSSDERQSVPVNEYESFPFCGSMSVDGFKDEGIVLTTSSISLPVSLLNDNGFGTGLHKDCLQVRITPMPLTDSTISGIVSGAGVNASPTSPESVPIVAT